MLNGSWGPATIAGEFVVATGNRVMVECRSDTAQTLWKAQITAFDADGGVVLDSASGYSGTWAEVRERIEKDAELAGQ
ncbi:hypothetical protein [Paractinoplanes durhamensis]|uniref:Uncharacterized protein n=1 Tax=Paractinoplanes durhamensis TaxID=113563 RepID=A0ABQ3YZN6_9ACTN|nr:hypothetical protein [Actinoplanes durhamensis]GIE03038.1 hypothetical protein Adu01nite_43880 [Actinoplanes durhamensis]